jgi:hypothetical protein
MADESPNQMIEADSKHADPQTLTHRPRDDEDTPNRLGTGKDEQENSTSGMLREAIQKVMEKIEFHEIEAKKHLHQAEELRNELRDSFAFLQERKGKALVEVTKKDQPIKATEPDAKRETKLLGSPKGTHERRNRKKKPAARKTKPGKAV